MTSNMGSAFANAPEELQEIVSSLGETEYASLTSAGSPISNPVMYYYNTGDSKIDLATGLAYPAKANRARNNPQVGLLLGRSVHAYDRVAIAEFGKPEDRLDLEGAPIVAIAAMGAVRDSDLQANTDKYVDLFLAEHPKIGPQDWDAMKDLNHYWIRIWIECTPVRVYWWPDGNLNDKPPEIWEAPLSGSYPTSDPRPSGKPTPRAKWPAEPWQVRAPNVLEQFPQPVLTSKTEDGFPLPIPTNGAKITNTGFELDIPRHSPCWGARGSASLSFGITATFVGELEENQFKVERLIGDLPNIFQSEGDEVDALNERQKAELERRGQVIPAIRRGEYLK